MFQLFFTSGLLLSVPSFAAAQTGSYDLSRTVIYSAEVEEDVLSQRPLPLTMPQQRIDTSSATMAWVRPFKNGFRALRKDGRMGLLHADLTLWLPFLYADVQAIPTGVNELTDFALIARRSSYGRYGVIDESGQPRSEFALSFNSRLLIYNDFILDSPHPGQYFIRHGDGKPASDQPFTAVWTHPILNGEGHRVVNVSRAGSRQLALFNLDAGKVVTRFAYDRISRVEPIVGENTYIPLLEGYTDLGIDLLRPSGKVLSSLKFIGVEGYNNWKQLRTYFGLPDDAAAEAIAWTESMDVYVIYTDDRVVHLGRYEAR